MLTLGDARFWGDGNTRSEFKLSSLICVYVWGGWYMHVLLNSLIGTCTYHSVCAPQNSIIDMCAHHGMFTYLLIIVYDHWPSKTLFLWGWEIVRPVNSKCQVALFPVFFAEYTNCEYKWKPIPTNKCVRFQKKCCFYAILFGWDLWNMMYSVVLYNNWSLVTVLLRPAWLSWTTKAVEPFSYQPHLHWTSLDPHAQKELQLNSFFHRPPLKKPSFATKVTPGLDKLWITLIIE